MTEKRSPAEFIRSIFRIGRFSKKKTKPVPTLSKKKSIKNIRKPQKQPKLQAMTLHQKPLSKPLFPISKPVKVRRKLTFTSSEFSLTLSRVSSSGNFYRGSSSNVTLVSSLGNLKPRNSNVVPLSKTISKNIVVRSPTRDLDPESLKIKGNVKYEEGKFEEALVLYDQAIMLDPKREYYYCNKSAALIGLGRLIEAITACEEAIQIDPCYERAHLRLATLYFRLGKAEKALYHYNEAGCKADSVDIAKSQALKALLTKCNKGREMNSWDLIAKQSQAAISSGADSAPQIYAMLVEALLKLHRHQEAYNKYEQAPKFEIESCTRLLGPSTCSYVLIVQAQVFLAMGRFEDAITNCREATRYSPNNEANTISKRVHAMVLARSSGNKLFKLCKFSEASHAYSQGLDHDPHNATLLCNRAACEIKLGHFRDAIEDCNGAIRSRPTYSKARLRRAECYAKLKNWEAAVQDYQKLTKETPQDAILNEAMLDAQLQLQKQRGEFDTKDTQIGSDIVLISTNEQFEHLTTLPGICVVLFCKKKSHEQVIDLLQQVCKNFPFFNFLKVEIEDHPLLAQSEGVASIPILMIYKDGLQVQEMSGKDREFLEQSLRSYRDDR